MPTMLVDTIEDGEGQVVRATSVAEELYPERWLERKRSKGITVGIEAPTAVLSTSNVTVLEHPPLGRA